MNQIHELNDDIYMLQNLYRRHKGIVSYPSFRIRKEKRILIENMKRYFELVGAVANINNEITQLGKRINRVKQEPKKVQFLIPHTIEFEYMKSKYVDVSMDIFV